MSPQGLIDKYYPEANELRHILLTHSRCLWTEIFCMKQLCCTI